VRSLKHHGSWVLTPVLLLAFGCKSGDMMARPARSSELDRLDHFVGTWQGEGTMKMKDAPDSKFSGVAERKWDLNKSVLTEKYTADMGEAGKMEGIGFWVWDAKGKKFRTFWFDDWGTVGTGSAKYNEKDDTWVMSGSSKNLNNGMRTVGKGTYRKIDDKSEKWTYSEYMPFPGTSIPLAKMFEMEGTGKKK